MSRSTRRARPGRGTITVVYDRGRSGACKISRWLSTTCTIEVCPSPDEPSACEELKLDRLTSF